MPAPDGPRALERWNRWGPDGKPGPVSVARIGAVACLLVFGGCGGDVVSIDGDQNDQAEDDGGSAGDGEDGGAGSDPGSAPEDPVGTQLVPRGVRVAITVATGPSTPNAEGLPTYPGRVDLLEVVDGQLSTTPLIDAPIVLRTSELLGLDAARTRSGPGWLATAHPTESGPDDETLVHVFAVASSGMFDGVEVESIPAAIAKAPSRAAHVLGHHVLVERDGLVAVDLDDGDVEHLTGVLHGFSVAGPDAAVYKDLDSGTNRAMYVSLGAGLETTVLDEADSIGILLASEDGTRAVWTKDDWSDDDHELMAASLDNPSEEPRLLYRSQGDPIQLMSMAPDGHAVTFFELGRDGKQTMYADLVTEDFVDLGATISSAAWSNDGRWLGSYDYVAKTLTLLRRDDDEVFSQPVSNSIDSLQTCGNGFAYRPRVGQQSVLAWTAFEADFPTVEVASVSIDDIACSRDQRWLAWVTADRAAYVTPMGADGPGEPERVLEAGGDRLRNATWSPDSSQLVLEQCAPGNLELDPCHATVSAWSSDTGGRTLLFEGDLATSTVLGLF